MRTHIDELEEHIGGLEKRSAGNIARYILMAFRPATVIIVCLLIAVAVAVPCLILISVSDPSSLRFQISLAVFTGVVASGILSVSLEMVSNYRRNYLRWIVLHEYLEIISIYGKLVNFCGHGRDVSPVPLTADDIFSAEFSERDKAVAETILEIGPKIEEAYKNGKQYMSHKEVVNCLIVIEAAEKLGDIANEVIREHLVENRDRNDIYDCLEDSFKDEIVQFADAVEISIVPGDDLGGVVADYILANVYEPQLAESNFLDEHLKRELRSCIRSFDKGMTGLEKIAAREPEYYTNRIPDEKLFERVERKLRKKGRKADKGTNDVLEAALAEGKITQAEFDEFYELDSVKDMEMPEIDFMNVSEEEEDEIIKRWGEGNSNRWHEAINRKMEIWKKAKM